MKGLLTAVLMLIAVSVHAESVKTIAALKPAPGGERRVALVIGNSAYKSAPLKNPVNDARAMANALAGAGFEVLLVEDARRAGMHRAIRDFGDSLLRGGVGLFYFAGHGMQVRNRNYLVPVDVEIEREDEVEFQAVDASLVLSKMDSARNSANIVILDACRNNPFQRSFRSTAQGLAQMDAPSGTLISFATAPGSVAADGEGENGVYTKHLLEQIRKPGTPVEQLFKQVRNGVMSDTKERQVPWESSSLRGDFFFLLPPPGMAAEDQKRQQQQEIEKAVSEAVKQSEERAARERAELEGKMKQLVEQMLAKQRADLESERKARGDPATAVPAPAPKPAAQAPQIVHSTAQAAVPTTSPVVAAAPAAVSPGPLPATVASIAPAPANAAGKSAWPAAGDHWVYRGGLVDRPESHRESTVEIRAVSDGAILEVQRESGRPDVEWAHAGGMLMRGGQVPGLNPYLHLFQNIGDKQTWSKIEFQGLGGCSTGRHVCDVEAAVRGRERVTVKAGTFDAIKIEATISLHHSFGQARSGGTSHITYWYAEQAKRVVKATMRGYGNSGPANAEFELVSYKLSSQRR